MHSLLFQGSDEEWTSQLDGGSATSGRVYKPLKVREWNGNRLKIRPAAISQLPFHCSCLKVAVLTTINPPTKTIIQLADLENWCLVIVGDEKTPTYPEWESSQCTVYLSIEDQEALPYYSVKFTPKNHFGRKSIGYLYAMHLGAEIIYDTDDDNELILDGPDTLEKKCTPKYRETGFFANYDNHTYLNPYPSFDPATVSPDRMEVDFPSVWPRGYPLDDIQKHHIWVDHLFSVPQGQEVGVYQSLANRDPDVDAIYRLTSTLPIEFTRVGVDIAVPQGVWSPFNAQATCWRKTAFYALLLPITVHGRVSDIWRSYVTERILNDHDILIAFSSAWVTQIRNPHTYMADFDAELHLYQKVSALLEILSQPLSDIMREQSDWESELLQLEALYIRLYEYDILQKADVLLAQAWIQDVASLWTRPARERQHNTPPSLTFLSSELHDGTRIDQSSWLVSLGHTFQVGGGKKNSSPYPDTFKMEGFEFVPQEFLQSPLVRNATRHSNEITMALRQDTFNYFKNLNFPVLKDVDAFTCQFPASHCLAWLAYNRTVIFLPSHRVFLGQCSASAVAEFISILQRSDKPKPVGSNLPTNIVSASQRYDAEYVNYFTGIVPTPLWSTGLKYLEPHHTSPWGSQPEILIGPTRIKNLPEYFLRGIGGNKTSLFTFTTLKLKYGRYTGDQMRSHRAVIFFPYATHSYGLLEFYASGVPVMIPTIDFLIKLGTLHDLYLLSNSYCKAMTSSELPPKHPYSPHPFSPEDQSLPAVKYWLRFAEYYQWPFVIQFNSWPDLLYKLEHSDLDLIHDKMEWWNRNRRIEMEQIINNFASRIEKGRALPTSWNAASQLYTI